MHYKIVNLKPFYEGAFTTNAEVSSSFFAMCSCGLVHSRSGIKYPSLVLHHVTRYHLTQKLDTLALCVDSYPVPT